MSSTPGYALGYAEVEYERLIRQARRLRGLTESFLRSAGIGEGMRVLDLGSGIGDVALLVASIVGPNGEVVGLERDIPSTERARARADEAGYANVSFREVDVMGFVQSEPFDAVVGRFILQFVAEPAAVLRSVAPLLRPPGIVAFQEVAWAPCLAANRGLSLWSACASAVHDAISAAGADTNAGLALYRTFADAGIPAPQVKLDMLMGAAPELVLWAYDLLVSVRSRRDSSTSEFDCAIDALGSLDTLADRLKAEVADARTAVTSVGVVSAWSRLD